MIELVAAADVQGSFSMSSNLEYPLMSSPHTYGEMKASGRTDTELLSILEHVHLAYLPKREGGWETRKEWKDVLS